MARYIGPKCKKCRRFGEKLFLKGAKCYTDKCIFTKRHAKVSPQGRKITPYGIQLQEKQKLKAIYGLLERQFRLTFERAQKKKNPGEQLLIELERRLDNVIFRLGFAHSRTHARQIVRHRHILINGRPVDIPSYPVKPNDEIQVREGKIREVIKAILQERVSAVPDWLSLDPNTLTARVLRLPTKEDITDISVNTQLIVELYSK
ncbi:MAG: 30S ribosomal protein S4 [candidate division WOR-3 bacterium]|nr:30S ribosomal protein S4 [candidate division WOR-3 bacterium]MCX7757775.1 30S ribosomal protein S4 [candidate division WOR-3 bacterium]MDW7988071.1 30S ribosomal protein S4 [candidate division WOR-3 bacterium]